MEYNKFDKRLVERNIESGLVTKEEYQEYLANLPDAASKSEVLNIPSPGFEQDSDDSKE